MSRFDRGKGRNLVWLQERTSHSGDECLIWPFGRMDKGYGQVKYGDKIGKAHRVMCILAHGEPPSPTHHAAHSCGKGHEGCVNPRHLSWKTPRENRIDSNLHGTGNVPKPRRLTFDQVQEIRGKGDKTLKVLSEEYGVHPDTISRVRRGKFWTTPRSTLTREQMSRLKELAGTMSIAAAAREVGVGQLLARNFLTGKTFTGVDH